MWELWLLYRKKLLKYLWKEVNVADLFTVFLNALNGVQYKESFGGKHREMTMVVWPGVQPISNTVMISQGLY